MQLRVTGRAGVAAGTATDGVETFPVLLGRNGPLAANLKREGDGCTPLGTYRVLYGLYRPDRLPLAPAAAGYGTHLSWLPITPQMGWCDAPTDPAYNTLVPVGYGASHEQLWRADSAYDHILVLDHNLPAVAGLGSAVFIHHWREDATHTEGCIALKPAHLEAVLRQGLSSIAIQLEI